ncbi:cAMP phosphodiesterases class-II-domain-containing protein [Amylocystis lapponica]|nr:cAMP phosphodiesterases class-II-domain-containing protein [Amylocystis lapponica]
MPTFELIALGCGGGPSEHNLSSYKGTIALDAGSGIGALGRLLQITPDLFGHRPADVDNGSPEYSATEVYSWIRCFLVTHSHLDHINSLILSAGALGGSRRQVFGAHHTLKDIEGIFSDRIWPKLASWDEDVTFPLQLKPLSTDEYATISDNVSVRMMPLSHGHNDTLGTYKCAAFFIRHDPSNREFLFFGDVEPDSIAVSPKNRDVWNAAAPKIPGSLDAIFIECSWPSGRTDETLYGHLSPEHLAAELISLAHAVADARKEEVEGRGQDGYESGRARKRQRREPIPPPHHGALRGVRIYIIHCKDDLHGIYDRPVNHIIADQVRNLVKDLEVEIIAVDQGMQISVVPLPTDISTIFMP